MKPEGKPDSLLAGAAVEQSFPSTTWAWKRVKIASPAGGQDVSGPKGRRWRGRVPWDRRRPLTITVSYRGGAQAWVEVHSRGDFSRYPGDTAIYDVLRDIWRDE